MQNIFVARSKFGKEIRLTRKIWFDKILAEHKEFAQRTDYPDEIKKIIEDPEYIVQGWEGELLAMRWCEIAPKTPKYLCVVYRELNGEGFVITAFFISRFGKLLRRKILWQKRIS